VSTGARFDGRAILVAGGAGGLGAAVTGALETAGARCAVLDRTPSDAEIAVRCDLADADQTAAGVAEAVAALGRLDGVLFASGVVYEAPSSTRR
jgi:NAD(P)-dependent dehydrogenase (short-subunit alcohol dehydrogenase family)